LSEESAGLLRQTFESDRKRGRRDAKVPAITVKTIQAVRHMIDAELLDAAASGDASAFMRLVEQYDKPLRSLAYKITTDAHLMQDVMQETYVKAYTQLPKFDRRSSFHTWIYRICHNAAIDQLRRNGKTSSVDIGNYELPVDSETSNSDQHLDVMAAIKALPVIHRSVVLLIDDQGFSYEEAAAILEISAGTVASRISHARKALRSSWGEYLTEKY
jgi:RNA polymerase sigma-70 factor (ECF subfamily)